MDPGFRLDGRYRMERRLARHGRAQVWRGRDELLERRVAVTLVPVPRHEPALRERIGDAIRAAAPAHPCAVTTYDCGEDEGPDGDALLYVVTEFLTGETLAARLARGLPTPQEAVAVCARVAGVLAAAHDCGAVHGALTPAEVFLTADRVKLLGLGPAGAIIRAGDDVGSAEDDVRALGRLIAECLTGDPGGPVDGSSGLGGLVARCRDGDDAGRPPAAGAGRILASWEPPPARGERNAGRPRVRRAAGLGGVCAVVLALALLPLLTTLSSLRDAPADVAVPLPGGPASRPAAVEPSSTAAPAGAVRAAAVSALARMRRSLDVGMAVGEVRPGFGTELATLVTALLDEVDGGTPVDLGRRIAGLRSALAGRAPGDVAPGRAAGLSSLLAEVPASS
ncbi:hypothetical protein [Actinomadura napierensis]|uniref:Protein kinase domain-containing protein n=1 Tax=Actinomadura napierensis TaxID=267854 RepID=A0ABN3AFX2_9ACTN